MDDPIFIPIQQLEMKKGEPAEFSYVVRDMKLGLTGQQRILKARRGRGKVNSKSQNNIEVISVTYKMY